MPRTKSTKSNQSNYKLLFPLPLRNKKIDPTTWEHCKYFLEEYLKTEDPEYLFQAIKIDFRILMFDGDASIIESLPLEYDEELADLIEKHEYVNQFTIVWTSIRYWRLVYFLEHEKNRYSDSLLGEDALTLLKRIGLSLLPYIQAAYTYKDRLMHRVPDLKLSYILAKDYVKRFDTIRELFKQQKKSKKFRGRELEKNEIKEEIVELIEELGEVDKDAIEDIITSNDSDFYKDAIDPTNKTTKFISLIHAHLCDRCRPRSPSHETLYNLYKDAKKDIKDFD